MAAAVGSRLTRPLHAVGTGFVADFSSSPAYVAPQGWTCDAMHYNSSDGCDCWCSVPDPDCGPYNASWCSGGATGVRGAAPLAAAIYRGSHNRARDILNVNSRVRSVLLLPPG